jgi:hypothetical protein
MEDTRTREKNEIFEEMTGLSFMLLYGAYFLADATQEWKHPDEELFFLDPEMTGEHRIVLLVRHEQPLRTRTARPSWSSTSTIVLTFVSAL